ncbi:MAG: cysteine methyltransferase [Candidatus Levybacteria bacterium RIFCSPHIGHO2_02_FULL_37_10]|nr:MAG: cysteine methyltransferase [Candidatus Levybacteria bacterium RIFCSPHIGHO2_02_FULL_37_10]
MNLFEKVYEIVCLIPKGKVATYKQIAKLAGIKNPRLVGFCLHKNTDPKNIPCHRVIKSNGYLAKGYTFGGLKKQKDILRKEGIKFSANGKINLEKYSFKP